MSIYCAVELASLPLIREYISRSSTIGGNLVTLGGYICRCSFPYTHHIHQDAMKRSLRIADRPVVQGFVLFLTGLACGLLVQFGTSCQAPVPNDSHITRPTVASPLSEGPKWWFRPDETCFLKETPRGDTAAGHCELDGPVGPYCPRVSKVTTTTGGRLLHQFDNTTIDPFPVAWARANHLTGKRAARAQIYNSLRGWLADEHAYGDILGISGSQLFSSFDLNRSRFTVADFPEADCHDLPFGDELFDFVIVQQVLEHVPHFDTCVHEFRRVLKTGGYVLFASPAFWPQHRHPRDFWRFMPDSVPIVFKCFPRIVLQGNHGHSNLIRDLLENPGNFNRNPIMLKHVQEPGEKLWPIYTWAIVQK